MLRNIGIGVLIVALAWIAFRTVTGGMGYGYYEVRGEGKSIKMVSVSSFELGERIKPQQEAIVVAEEKIEAAAADATLSADEKSAQVATLNAEIEELRTSINDENGKVHFSMSRTLGIWLAAFFTLCIMSFLYKDNPLYRFAEHTFVGASAAYWMVVTFWNMAVPMAFGRLFRRWVKFNLAPGMDLDGWVEKLAAESWLAGIVNYESAVGHALNAPWYQIMNWWYWIPMVLGVMLLWRLAPSGQWISRWPLAFIIGGTAGLRMVAFLQADFVTQIRSSISPLFILRDGAGSLAFGEAFYASMNSIILLLGMLTVLVYFFFSLEHKGVVGRVSRVGIWVLMVTFGAGFGFTVMGRIALLVGRFEFLVNEWINYSPR